MGALAGARGLSAGRDLFLVCEAHAAVGSGRGGDCCGGLGRARSSRGSFAQKRGAGQHRAYARTRNPLYLGSSLLALAFAVASRSWVVFVVLGAYFLTFYPAVMRREESELRAQYGASVRANMRAACRYSGRSSGEAMRQAGTDFSFAQYRRNREYQAAIGVAVLLAMLVARAVWRK